MTAALILLAIIAALAVAVYLAARAAAAQKRRADDAEQLLVSMQDQLRMRDALSKKIEEAHDAQAERQKQVSSGDPGADFAGSLDVLRDVSQKRRAGQ